MILKGVGIGRGVAVSPVLRMAEPLPEPKDEPRAASVSAEAENARVTKALAAVNADLNRRAQEAANGDEGTKQAAEILQAVAMFASDPALAANIAKMVDDGKTGERAVLEGFGQVEEMFRQIGGYQGERAADLHDVGQRVIAELMGRPAPGVPQSETPFVLVAKDLSPADTASLDLDKTLAIVTSEGGPTSHTAILCRARGIVAVVSAAEAVDLTDGETVIVNAARGEVTTDPTDEQLAAAHDAKLRADKAKELRGQPGQLKDGHRIPLLANVGKPSDAKTALEYGAEGVGLFRTEFLFIGNEEPPTVEEQTKAYAELLAQFPGKKVVIRLLDAGADKPLPFLTPEDEPNPALGLRGLRTLAQHKAVLEGQLKALAAADAQTDADLWVMAPMVADEWEAEYFTKLGKSFGLKFVGSMAEVPSIAVMADKVSQVTDFVSIGTNDLTQYTLAADRTLGSVSNYQTAWHPAVLRVIKMICEAGNKNGMPVGVCGEAAADPDLAVVLAGLGVNSLSMTPVALDDVRAELAQHTLEEAQQIAAKALNGDFYNPPQWCELGE
ncbi:phosphoenolpyruvate--protein phosphotransferase [Bifidobacterium pseudolongum]|uniref:phosphoenolpyruvate--protein phosphotransferase n=1 Tax=Bifidobacterium pseudolongum TaxID=1694 RepID=UPI0003B36E80|nr:phosphoenolpyruvate--protein phosphotransferase [Bifidobacterium pseudolongum]RYQ55938.1 phosphoenolpyruvate--protein phosphotransferase [Bifidobacterium pseudolongum subsp. globosum]RYQ71463.1 phosphoenolpyruvate--protein phosphotransferase [Bifidobacterium pseudolongum subsp. globosum]RYQ78175.1 phosphoenolpyruvate--protein phosphotransferase [Bifidobacterium pseudolongum subsp. globosum]HJE55322.1 phosphoenolpyruvate--protein phosphotransferase [Bifidobacterium pseudolongum subsp. globosu